MMNLKKLLKMAADEHHRQSTGNYEIPRRQTSPVFSRKESPTHQYQGLDTEQRRVVVVSHSTRSIENKTSRPKLSSSIPQNNLSYSKRKYVPDGHKNDAGESRQKTSPQESHRSFSGPLKKRKTIGRFYTSKQARPGSIKGQAPLEDPHKVDYDAPGRIRHWPNGWKRRTVERQSGATKGMKDHYWYTPIMEYELRSEKQVRIFMKALKEYNGDEKAALESIGGAK